MTIDEKKIAELKEKHGGNLSGVQMPDGSMLVFRKPTRFEYDRFSDTISPGNKVAPTRELAKSCLVHPTESEFMETLDRYPALLTNEITFAIQELSGFVEDFPVKKL